MCLPSFSACFPSRRDLPALSENGVQMLRCPGLRHLQPLPVSPQSIIPSLQLLVPVRCLVVCMESTPPTVSVFSHQQHVPCTPTHQVSFSSIRISFCAMVRMPTAESGWRRWLLMLINASTACSGATPNSISL